MEMSKKDLSIARELSEQGKRFSEDLRDNNRSYFEDLPYSYFAIASAISLNMDKTCPLWVMYQIKA